MTRIALISDTHGYLDESIFKYVEHCHEIWHAGDIGSRELTDELINKSGLILRVVYGNIDGQDIRGQFPEQLVFICEQVKVLMRHIGGSPPKYNPETRKELELHQPQLFITGHSHILKIMYDDRIRCLYMNPGAAGKHGWHKVRTLVRFTIHEKEIKDCEVIELGKR